MHYISKMVDVLSDVGITMYGKLFACLIKWSCLCDVLPFDCELQCYISWYDVR